MADDERSGNLVARWRQGDQQAAAELFRRYVSRLTALARSRLPAQLARRVDPEDIVQSVYRSFFANAREDRYEFARGGDLWRLLVAITLDKLQDHVKWNTRAKRAVGRDQNFGHDDSLFEMHALAREPSPLEALALAEQIERAMRALKPLQRRMFELRLQGHNLEEIAVATQRSQRTVIRVLEEIKKQLSHWLDEGADS